MDLMLIEPGTQFEKFLGAWKGWQDGILFLFHDSQTIIISVRVHQ